MSTAPTRWSPWSPRADAGSERVQQLTEPPTVNVASNAIQSAQSAQLANRSIRDVDQHLADGTTFDASWAVAVSSSGNRCTKFGERSGLERGRHLPDRTIESLVARGIDEENAA